MNLISSRVSGLVPINCKSKLKLSSKFSFEAFLKFYVKYVCGNKINRHFLIRKLWEWDLWVTMCTLYTALHDVSLSHVSMSH